MFYTINDFRQNAFSEVYKVYEVFQNYFGKENTDLQGLPTDDDIAREFMMADINMREDGSGYEAHGNYFNSVMAGYRNLKPFILVYWPRVRVTNENNFYIDIDDLYAKIELNSKGQIPTENRGFTLNRSTYTMEQWVCGYMHSHISSIPKENLTAFQMPCLGSGPINSTINSLRAGIAEEFDELKWMLFCEELSRYVTVESLKGIPYNHLENVCMAEVLSEFSGFDDNQSQQETALRRFKEAMLPEDLGAFILYYLQHGHLAIGYQQGCFKVSMSYYEYILDISNAFIDWFNQENDSMTVVNRLFNHYILYHIVIAGGKFLDPDSSRRVPDLSRYIGKKVCDFQGHEVRLNIKTSGDFQPQRSIILSHGLSMYILNNILKIINYHYRNEYTRQHSQGSAGSAALSATIGQRAYYL